MSGMPDWTVWIIAIAVIALFAWFFGHTGATLLRTVRALIVSIQHWPEARRAMTEAEAQAGGRYPLWYRAIRVSLVIAMVALAALLVWRKVTGEW